MTFAHIIGTGSFLPERVIRNEEFEKFIDTSDEWITRRTGIKERRISRKGNPEETTTAMGTAAARSAMQVAKITPDKIDTIIVASVTQDRIVPSAACLIQNELGANNAAAYDIAAGCSGFIFGLELGNNHIKAGTSETVLIIGVERLSSILNWRDRGTCVLLGDGAGAAILQGSKRNGGILSTQIKSDGRFWDLLYADEENDYLPDNIPDVQLKPFHLKMEGNRLFKQAVGSMAAAAEKALSQNGLSREDIDLIIPHQANMRIVQAVAEKLDVPMEKVFTNLQKYGNTSAATIPVAMDEAYRQGRISKGDLLLMVSFGAGLTWGAVLARWSI
jgi:3-oxoacyl-[acyl-carrier-protein] synthase-3